jgi:hypothetical protein
MGDGGGMAMECGVDVKTTLFHRRWGRVVAFSVGTSVEKGYYMYYIWILESY